MARKLSSTIELALYQHMYYHILKSKSILTVCFLLGLSFSILSQSPKKYLKNGFHEQAYVEAVYKQNKKVKLKKKFTEVIYASYPVIYKKHSELIQSSQTNWQQSYDRFIRMTHFLARVKHPGVYDNLENILFDETNLEFLAAKFNDINRKDLQVAASFESVNKYEKSLELYEAMALRHKQVTLITTISSKLILIDCQTKIDFANQKIGDQRIVEAQELLAGASTKEAKAAIQLIEEARTYRPLDIEEEELLTLANLIIGESWILEAQKLLKVRTKKNARLAYELINRARTIRTLKSEEEEILTLAQELGTTRIVVKTIGKSPIFDAETLSGILNKEKSTQWVNYYAKSSDAESVDFELIIMGKQPAVVLGDVRKEITQNTKTVEYWEEETNASGNTVKVKKTRLAIAMVSKVSRTKSAGINWTARLKDKTDGHSMYSESRETKQEITNAFVSLESGDILALPQDIESEIDLDSQPFPSDQEMKKEVKKMYQNELITFIRSQKDHLKNITNVIPE